MAALLRSLIAIGLLVGLVGGVRAQDQSAAPAAAAPAAVPSQPLLKPEEIDQLVAPIALYPDTLLAQVLMASTYPLEVVQADRWVKTNQGLKGDALKAAVDKQTWDASLKSLTATPSVLDMMSNKLDWTQKLGDAVLAQQPDVMDGVQRLRARAQAQNKLQSTKEQKVSVKTEQSKQIIVIEPTQPNTVYVPYYNPAVVYGAWPYAAYPPYYFPPAPGYYAGAAIATGIAFGAGVAIGAWAAGGYWGGNVNWGNNNINVNRNINNINVNNNWRHDVNHRHGVRYNNANVAQQFGKGNRPGADNRMDFRGRGGEQVLRPGGDRPGPGGDRPGAGGDRGGLGGGDRPGAGNRPGAGGGGQQLGGRGDRPGAGGGGRPQQNLGQRGGGRDNAFSNVGNGRNAMAHANRGHASLGGMGGGGFRGGMGGGGGGGFRGGGGGGFRGGGGGGGGGGRGRR